MSINPAILLKRFTIDAESGDLSAQSTLALLFYSGESAGIQPDYAKAKKWALIAAERGDAQSQSILGFLYLKGLGVVKDYDQAVYWFEKGDAQGDLQAKNGLLMVKIDRQLKR
jgi:TPR repeat protein